MPDDAPANVDWRLAHDHEIPRGAATVANAARKAGWTVLVGFARGPWIAGDDDEDAAPEDVKICEMVTVQGRRGRKKFRVTWRNKLWTQAEYQFTGGQTHPPIEGEVVATKAKKDRHPEHLGDKTIGGLKNSKTMNAFIREADSE